MDRRDTGEDIDHASQTLRRHAVNRRNPVHRVDGGNDSSIPKGPPIVDILRPRQRRSESNRNFQAVVARQKAFTLIELLVVILIILIVSAVALPVVLPAMSHRQVSEGARALQAGLSGARDSAIRNNAPSGLRFLPDPAFPISYVNGQVDGTKPLASNRWIPIGPAPDYTEGLLNVWQGALPATVAALPYPGPPTPAIPNPTWANTTVLMVYESPVTTTTSGATVPNAPTSWFWNVRLGDTIQINSVGPKYTVVGPMNIGPQGATINGTFYANNELFVNVGPPGTVSPFALPTNANIFPEFLLLVNGRDDNKNGLIDEGWNGRDDDGQHGIDDIGEWVETEKWLGAVGNQGLQ
jgi:prepilin-type N-terminal cleavage/methylation domain-containing protein